MAVFQGASDASIDKAIATFDAAPEKAKLPEAAPIVAAFRTERTFRDEVAKPMCEAEVWIQQGEACIREEKANASGVVNLARLHECGEWITRARADMKQLAPAYTARRKHVYKGWQSEGTCAQYGE